jgi:hypothetical protein
MNPKTILKLMLRKNSPQQRIKEFIKEFPQYRGVAIREFMKQNPYWNPLEPKPGLIQKIKNIFTKK